MTHDHRRRIIVVMLPDASDIMFGAMNMNMAVRTSIQYAMNSGNEAANAAIKDIGTPLKERLKPLE